MLLGKGSDKGQRQHGPGFTCAPAAWCHRPQQFGPGFEGGWGGGLGHTSARAAAKHYQFFLGDRQSGRPLPPAFGIQQLWEEPSLVQQVYSAIPYNESIDFSNYIVITQGQFRYFMYFMNNLPNVFADNYFLRRKSQSDSDTAPGAGGMCAVLPGPGLHVVARQRFSIYSVFLGVPTGLVKALATMRMDLDDEDEDDEVEGELNTAEAAANAAANKESAAVHSTYEPPQQSYAALSFKGATFPSASGPPQ
ncbi:hypothetical protein HaLaN_26221, partial [Haematococcus lacustris]